MDSLRLFCLDQGIPVEYELDTFNTPPQEQLYVTPKIGYVDALPYFCSRHTALNSPLVHFNGNNARLSPNHQTLKTHGDSKVHFLQRQTWLSLNYGEHYPSHVPRHALPSQLYHISISSPYSQSFQRDLQHKKQTQYSMLQIKTIPKNISTCTS